MSTETSYFRCFSPFVLLQVCLTCQITVSNYLQICVRERQLLRLARLDGPRSLHLTAWPQRCSVKIRRASTQFRGKKMFVLLQHSQEIGVQHLIAVARTDTCCLPRICKRFCAEIWAKLHSSTHVFSFTCSYIVCSVHLSGNGSQIRPESWQKRRKHFCACL